jgi:hypothetical protein
MVASLRRMLQCAVPLLGIGRMSITVQLVSFHSAA